MPILANFASLSTVLGAVLLLPTAATLWFRWAALRADEAKQRVIWAGFRKFGRFILTDGGGLVGALGFGWQVSIFSRELAFLAAARCELRSLFALVFRSR